MLIKKIVVLGGTGFVGSSLCNRLSKEGYQIKILTRNREYNRENLILILILIFGFSAYIIYQKYYEPMFLLLLFLVLAHLFS